MSANSSAFSIGSAAAPDGNQVALIKDNGNMSQVVYFDAGTYNISFLAAQRVDYQTQNQQIRVIIDGNLIGSVTPDGGTFLRYQMPNFPITAGIHTVEFLGMSSASADSTAFIDDATISAGSAIGDGSFEDAVMAAGAYQFSPSGTPWQFAGNAGVSANNSGFTLGNAVAPDGNQVAFIKDTGTMSQSLYMAAGLYNVSFMAAQRNYHQSQSESLKILVDGVQVGTATPSGTTYGLYQTSTFTVTAGLHTIELVGVNPMGGDNTAFVDEVQLNA